MGHPQNSAADPARQRSPSPRRTSRPVRLPGTGMGERWVFGFSGRARAEVHTLGARLHSLLLPDRWGHFADVLRPDAVYRSATILRFSTA